MAELGYPDANQYNAIYAGVVTDNVDPEKLGRVRVRVPGITDEPDSEWALPAGMPGAGVSKRGFFDTPGIGAEVYVFFLGGDVDRPRYFPGHWGTTEEGPEVPTQVREALDEDINDADKIKVYETNTYVMVFDEREGKERFFIKRKRELEDEPGFSDEDLEGGNALMIELDATNGTLALSAPGAIVLRSLGLIDIDASIVQVAGRKVTNGIVDGI